MTNKYNWHLENLMEFVKLKNPEEIEKHKLCKYIVENGEPIPIEKLQEYGVTKTNYNNDFPVFILANNSFNVLEKMVNCSQRFVIENIWEKGFPHLLLTVNDKFVIPLVICEN